MKSRLFVIFAALALTPGLTFAATSKKKTATTASSPESTSLLSSSGFSSGMPNLKGLSVFAAYDLADSTHVTGDAGSTDLNTDTTFILGAQYEFSQFSKGFAAQVGGDYEFSRSIKDHSKSWDLTSWLPYVELAAQLTPQFTVMGGVNYGFPSLSGANGLSIKGKVGFQFGGSFAMNKNFAVDGRYRIINDSLSVDGGGSGDTKLSGFMFDARYVFQ